MKENILKFRNRLVNRRIFFIIIILISAQLFAVSYGAAQDDAILAEQYAPILYFEAEETCYPVDAQYHLDNSQYTCYDQPREETCYYDNSHGTIKDDGVIYHYKNVKSSYTTTVYYRVYTSGITKVIQYWMFYAFNKGELNQHEGDWEMIQVVLVNELPSWVGYSQHHWGQRATWAQVEKEGDHIKVYVARGSHANYLRSFSGKLGIATDIVGANGDVLKNGQYTLDTLEDKTWIDFEGGWGEGADNEADALEASLLGQAGPQGPKYRENGAMWDDPVAWGNSLFEANDMLFNLEWLMYNFVTLFLLITLVILAIMLFFIYRRHKKYGLGPRKISMLYINGFNLHSIGNILCIVGIILAIFGLFTTWYQVSYGVSGTGIDETFQTEGMVDLLKFDGINGLQINIPGTSGPAPLGSLVIPFSLFIGIGLLFLIIATIGIPLSKKLGWKYLWRGIRIIIPFILILIAIGVIGSVIPNITVEGGSGTNYVQNIIGPISSSPFGGQSSTAIAENGITGTVNVHWGLGIGGWLLLIAGIILVIAGILEILAKTQFFATKISLPGQGPPQMPVQPLHIQQTPIPEPYLQSPQQQETPKGKSIYCTDCGTKLKENAAFCVKCGKKVK